MERVVNLTHSYEEADDWDIRQCLEMTYAERQRVARTLKTRLHPGPEDVRDCLRDKSKASRRQTSGNTSSPPHSLVRCFSADITLPAVIESSTHLAMSADGINSYTAAIPSFQR